MPETDCAATEGAACVGWGGILPGDLYNLMKLHVMYFDLLYRLPSIAQAGSSNLMWQLVGTMDQAQSGVKNPDMLAPIKSRLSLFVGHDMNLTAIGGFLDVSWKAEGFRQNDPSPAGALVFELHRVRQSGALAATEDGGSPDEAPAADRPKTFLSRSIAGCAGPGHLI